MCMHVHSVTSSCVWLSVTLWTIALQVPLSMEFSRQEYWSGLPCPPPGDLLDPGIELMSPVSPELQMNSLLLSHRRSPIISVKFSCSVVSDSLRPHGLQHARPPCPSPTPRVHPNPCPLSWWCHPTTSSSVVPFSSCPQSLPASGSFQLNQLFASGGQSIGISASASVLPMNLQDWSPLGWTSWISLLSKGLSRVFSNATVQKHQFFSAQLFFTVQLSHPYVTTGKIIALTRQTFIDKVMPLCFLICCLGWS